ncbi:MAG: sulfatase-like hydrolase/transferase [Bryobacteraceae bacterium]
MSRVDHKAGCPDPGPWSMPEENTSGRNMSWLAASGAWKDFCIALSLANLCYLRLWSGLLTYGPEDAFFMKAPPAPAHYLAAVVNTLVLGAIFWVALRGSRRLRPGWQTAAAEWLFLLLLLLPLNAIRNVLSSQSEQLFQFLRSSLLGFLGSKKALFLAVVALAIMPVLARWRHRLVRSAMAVLLVFSPAVPLTLARGVWGALRSDSRVLAAAPAEPRPLASECRAPRVLWILFDEWDQRLTFDSRAPGIRLPELDRFLRTSLCAMHAYPPSSRTICSVSSLTTGRLVSDVKVTGTNDLRLMFAGGTESARWRDCSTVFSDAQSLGLKTAIVGWFLPYSRALGGDVTTCWWWEMSLQHNSTGERFSEIAPNQALSLFETTQLAPWGQSRAVKNHVQVYHEMIERALSVVTDPSYRVIFLHLPVPHSPHAYDRKTGTFTRANSPISGYWDSLELLDRTLSEIRLAMEHAGQWDSTTVLLSSDHWNRSSRLLDGKEDHRVPFLLKMAGQRSGLAVPGRMETVWTRELLAAIMRREISTPSGVAEWIDGRARRDLKNH